jgi:hypothetical protein
MAKLTHFYLYYNRYTWLGADRQRFRYSDSAVTGAYKHAGRAEPLQNDVSFATDLFAGIVCIATPTIISSSSDSSSSSAAVAAAEALESGQHTSLWRTDGTAAGTGTTNTLLKQYASYANE